MPVGAAQQDGRLNADAEQFLDRMLRRLGLQLSGGRDVGQQRQVDEQRVLVPDLVAELADRLKEGRTLDVADGAADLAQDEVLVRDIGADELLDRVGDVRDDLDRGAQVIAAPLALDHGGIDAPGGDVVALARGDAGEPLVMAEVEVGFRPVVGDIYLTVLIRAHGARIDVEIGVELTQPHLEFARLEQCAQRGGGKALAERGNDAAGNEYVPSHWCLADPRLINHA